MRLLKLCEKQAVIHFPLPVLRIYLAVFRLAQVLLDAAALRSDVCHDVTQEDNFFEDGSADGDTSDIPPSQPSANEDVILGIEPLGRQYVSRNDIALEYNSCSHPHSTGPPPLHA